MVDLVAATPLDDALVAQMNRSLIEDEGSSNPMTVAELEGRLARLRAEGQRVTLACENGRVVGYCMWCELDASITGTPIVRVRQLFVARAERSRGVGKTFFDKLRAAWPPDAVIELEVLVANVRARNFYERMGFDAYATTLRRAP